MKRSLLFGTILGLFLISICSVSALPTQPNIIFPNGGENLYNNVTINWTQSTSPYDVFYYLDYSNNSGTTWYPIVSNYGYIDNFQDDFTLKNFSFSGDQNLTDNFPIPINAVVTSAKMNVSGFKTSPAWIKGEDVGFTKNNYSYGGTYGLWSDMLNWTEENISFWGSHAFNMNLYRIVDFNVTLPTDANWLNLSYSMHMAGKGYMNPQTGNFTINVWNYTSGEWYQLYNVYYSDTGYHGTCLNRQDDISLNSDNFQNGIVRLNISYFQTDPDGSMYGGTGLTTCDGATGKEVAHAFIRFEYKHDGVSYLNNTWIEVGTIDGNREWNWTGQFNETNKRTDDFSSEINSYLSGCTPINGTCYVPLTLHSDEGGVMQIDDINIHFNISDYWWDTSSIPYGTHYRTRVKAGDQTGNTSYDSSNADFSLHNTAPTISGVPDNSTIMNDYAMCEIDLFPYISDSEDADENLTLSIISQNDSLINCTIRDNRYLNCSDPTENQTGSNIINISVEDRGGLKDYDVVNYTVTNDGSLEDISGIYYTYSDCPLHGQTCGNGKDANAFRRGRPAGSNATETYCTVWWQSAFDEDGIYLQDNYTLKGIYWRLWLNQTGTSYMIGWEKIATYGGSMDFYFMLNLEVISLQSFYDGNYKWHLIQKQTNHNEILDNDTIYSFAIKGQFSYPRISDGLNGLFSWIYINPPARKVLENRDTDNDGWNDYYEMYVKYTDPEHNDTDDDNILDISDPNPNTPDVTPPLIYNITVTTFRYGADFYWQTNENSTTMIEYGENLSYGTNTTINITYTTEHYETISGLDWEKKYYYKLWSCDISGNCNNTITGDFTTPSPSVMEQLPSITGALVVTTGFGIIGLFTVLTFLAMVTETTIYEPRNFIRMMIGIVIVISILAGIFIAIIT